MRPTTYAAAALLSLAIVPGAGYAKDYEILAKDEVETANKVANELIKQIGNDYKKEGKRVFRDAHPRGIGCVRAQFTVDSDLRSEYQTGVFAQPGKTYEAIVRFSSSLGPQGDNIPDARGMAIKLFGVPGTKLLSDQPNATTHDFLQINSPIFPAKNTHDFGGIVKIKSNPLNVVPFIWEDPITHISELIAVASGSFGNPYNGSSLAETQFFSMTPYLLRSSSIESPIKFSSKPCASNFKASRKLDGGSAELRNDLQVRLKEDGDLCYDFMVQFYKDGVGFDVEDGMSEWTEDKAPFQHVAKIKIYGGQNFLQDDKLRYCDNLSFQPWHALAEHRPLGNLNRSRKIIYEAISKSRHASNNESSRYNEPEDTSAFDALNNPAYKAWDTIKVEADKPGAEEESP